MCGLVLVVAKGRSHEQLVRMADAALDAQATRGPDGRGVMVVDGKDGVSAAIGHLRLAVIDPRAASDQPLHSDDGQSSLIFNGEIYNYKELRATLAPRPVLERALGDSGALLAGLDDEGPAFLSRANGMWSLFYHSARSNSVLISRDRFGIKPIFVYHAPGDLLIISSEIKGILAILGRTPPVEPEAIAEYLLRGRTNHGASTFYQGIKPFDVASWAEVPISAQGLASPPATRSFWELPSTSAARRPASAEEIRELFLDAVRIHLRADVPLAVTLSGGIDSTAIVSAARHLDASAQLTAYSVASSDPKVSEERFQELAARHAGCEWRRVYLDDEMPRLTGEIDQITWYNDQPLKSLSDLALFELCRRARADGTVVMLNGQGADEQLCGYNKYLYFHLIEQARSGRLGRAATDAMQFAANGTVFNEFRITEAKRYAPMLGRRRSVPFGPALDHAAQSLAPLIAGRGVGCVERADLMHNSIPQLLHAEDRLSMASSTEMRVPFLDYRLVERLASTPVEQKLHKGWTKHVFREALAPLMPPEITWRRDKKGFALPLDAWARQYVLPMMSQLRQGGLAMHDLGLVSPAGLQQVVSEFTAGQINGRELFRYLALEVWLRRFSVDAVA